MDILYLATGVFDKGGISRYCRYQIEALRRCSSVEKVFVMSLYPPVGDVFEEEFQVDNYCQGISLLSKLRFSAGALQVASTLKPKIIWSNHINLAPALYLASAINNSMTVVNIYGREMWSGLGRLHVSALRRCDRIVSDCYFTADWARDNLAVNHSRIRVIWDCVDINKFMPGPADMEIASKYGVSLVPGRIRLMTLGRLESEQMHKGYHRILEMLAQIRDSLPVDYIIGGTGSALPQLQQLAENLDVRDRVYFTGSINEADLSAVYRLADIFVLISDRGHGRGEGIPLTPLEAAACGVPILVGNEDGSQEAVEDGVNGFILSPHDRKTLIDRISLLVEDSERRDRMGIEARLRIERLHSFEGFSQATQNVLSTI